MDSVESRCLKVQCCLFNPVKCTWNFETYPLQGFWTADLEKEPLYLFTETELRRFDREVSALEKEYRQLKEELDKYREYFRLQNELSDKGADDVR